MKSKMVPSETKRLSRVLRSYAEKYETASFIEGDPSWFIHQVSGKANQEVIQEVSDQQVPRQETGGTVVYGHPTYRTCVASLSLSMNWA